MLRTNKQIRRLVLVLSLVSLCGMAVVAQERATTGGLRGRVRVEVGSPAGVSVTVRQGDREVRDAKTNAKGEFEVAGLAPGRYGLTFRKAGLQIGRMENVEVRAGKTISIKDKLYLPVDEGAIAFIRGSVFDAGGRGLAGAKVELLLVEPDGTLKKVDSRVTNGLGQFGFRMTAEAARYRVTAAANGASAAKDVEINSAAIFRVALTLEPAK